MHGVMNSG